MQEEDEIGDREVPLQMVNTLQQWKQHFFSISFDSIPSSFHCFMTAPERSFGVMMAIRIVVGNSYFVSSSVSYQLFVLNSNEFEIENIK